MIKRNSPELQNIVPIAKFNYLTNHGFMFQSGFFYKNNVYLSTNKVYDLCFEDLQKYTYMANNFFGIDEEDNFVADTVIVEAKEFYRFPLNILHICVKEAFQTFREKNTEVIN